MYYLLMGIFIVSCDKLRIAKRGLSVRDIERYEKKHGRPMTDEDKTIECNKLKKTGIVGVVLSLLFLALFIFITTYNNMNA